MTQSRKSIRLWASSVVAAVTVFSSTANAQQPGTNMPTPPPTPTPQAMPGDPVPFEISPTTGTVGKATDEPVIDAATVKRVWPNRPLLLTGLVVFGGSYGASAIVAATSGRSTDDKLYYPVVGPWMDLDARDCTLNPCSNKTLDQVLLVGDGVLQGLGALGMVLSLVVPETTTRHWYLVGNNDLVIAPRVEAGLTGVSAVGRF